MDGQSEAELLNQHMGLVRHIAGRLKRLLRGGAMDHDDLVQCGAIGLLLAIRRFEPERGVTFSTFAAPYIRGLILNGIYGEGFPIRTPRHVRRAEAQEVMSLSNSDGFSSGQSDPTDPQSAQSFRVIEARDQLSHLMSKMTARERQAAMGVLSGQSATAVARELGLGRNLWEAFRQVAGIG